MMEHNWYAIRRKTQRNSASVCEATVPVLRIRA